LEEEGRRSIVPFHLLPKGINRFLKERRVEKGKGRRAFSPSKELNFGFLKKLRRILEERTNSFIVFGKELIFLLCSLRQRKKEEEKERNTLSLLPFS
jgi:hypothetical protein